MADHQYLSIGEVLGLLLEDFPDVTISKIRFLESQGLIEPERTPSGYRKFYDGDVELLRAILHEQKANFLPLKVIRDRIESGAIDSDGGGAGGRTPPRGIRNVEHREVREVREASVASSSDAEARDSVFRRTDGGPEWAGGQALIPGETDPSLFDAGSTQSPITAAVPIVPSQPPSQPSAPQRSAQPAAPQPAAPQPSAPQSSAPQSSAPQPSAPQPSAPQPSAPQPAPPTAPQPTAAPRPPAPISQPAPRPPNRSTSPSNLVASLIEPVVRHNAVAPPAAAIEPNASSTNSPIADAVSSAVAAEPRTVGAEPADPVPTKAAVSHLRSASTDGVRELPYNRTELCDAASITAAQLAELQDYGIVTARGSGADASFQPESVEIAQIAGQLLSQGIDARHLRAWRQAAERESALFEQRIMPLLRQRNPQARQAALASLSELSGLGARLHNALVDSLLQHHFDG